MNFIDFSAFLRGKKKIKYNNKYDHIVYQSIKLYRIQCMDSFTYILKITTSKWDIESLEYATNTHIKSSQSTITCYKIYNIIYEIQT